MSVTEAADELVDLRKRVDDLQRRVDLITDDLERALQANKRLRGEFDFLTEELQHARQSEDELRRRVDALEAK